MQQLTETFKRVKLASKSLALLSDQQRNDILCSVADTIIDQQNRILTANAADLAKMDPKNPLYDRLQLTHKRLADIANDMRNVASLPSPLGFVTKEKTLPNGLRLHRVSVPFGVIGMIYEARPSLLALLQEWQRLCAERRKRCRPLQSGIGRSYP